MSKGATQFKKSVPDYMIDATFRNINRLFAFSFRLGRNINTRTYFNTYYLRLVGIVF